MHINRFGNLRTTLLHAIATLEEEGHAYLDYNAVLDILPCDMDICMLPIVLFLMTGNNHKVDLVSSGVHYNGGNIHTSRRLRIERM
jgi:hypothetical protein